MKKFVLFLTAIILTASAFGQSDNQMEKRFDTTSIPDGINNPAYVLIVRIPFRTKSSVQKYTEVMEKNYSGRFEVVPFNKPFTSYSDSSKYRYILMVSLSQTSREYTGVRQRTGTNPEGVGTLNSSRSSLFIFDRQTQKVYQSGLSSANTEKILGFYAQKLSGK